MVVRQFGRIEKKKKEKKKLTSGEKISKVGNRVIPTIEAVENFKITWDPDSGFQR